MAHKICLYPLTKPKITSVAEAAEEDVIFSLGVAGESEVVIATVDVVFTNIIVVSSEAAAMLVVT